MATEIEPTTDTDGARPGVPVLRGVIDDLGSSIAHLLAAPAGLDVVISRALIHDPLEHTAIMTGDVVLGVATPPGGHDAVGLIDAAGDAAAAAVIVKDDGTHTDSLVAAARRAGVAVLALEPSMAWDQLYTLLRTATAATTQADTGDGVAGAVGDLFSLANAIAAMVGGPTTIEDRESTVLAYSSLDEPIDEHRRQTILGRRVSEEWRTRLQDDGHFKRLWHEYQPVRIEYPNADPPMKPRLAIAVRAGGEILGSIWVAEGRRPLNTDAPHALEEAARIAALHLLRARSSEDLDRERRAGLLRSVLDGTAAPEALADALDVDMSAYVTVLAFRLQLDSPEDVAVRTRRATNLISVYCESYRRKAAAVATGPVVYVLLPDSAEPDRRRLISLAEDIIERVRGPLRTDVSAGIGTTVAGLDRVAVSRRHADQVLRVLPATGVARTIEDMRSETILATLREHARQDPELRIGKLELLEQMDADKDTSYIETLAAYLDFFGDVPAAAASISVHQNTFRYRLKRLVEVAAIDLDDSVERLITHLQLHLSSPRRRVGPEER